VKPIRKGDFIAFYTGRLIRNEEADKLWTKYMFEINSRWTLDGSSRRNIARYINHSCKPNAESDVKGHEVHITAIKNIQAGDEIAYNYGRDYFDTFIKPRGCRCMACTQKPIRKRSSRRRSSRKRS
jgi:SET domain-containing protein